MARILLIDDNDPVRNMLVLLLKRFGHIVIPARDGQEGLDLYTFVGADLVITDMMMPRKGGLEVIKELKEIHPRVKVIAMSGGGPMDETHPLDTALRLGVDRAINKPFSCDHFITVINEVLAGVTTNSQAG
jgi:CheY-like chemotaxis protein